MGRVKEAVLASLVRPIVSPVSALWSPWRIPLSVPSVRYGLRHRLLSSYIDHKIRQNLYTRINIHTRQLCESSTRYHSCGF